MKCISLQAFLSAINFHEQTPQGNLHVSREFGGKESLQLKGPEIAAELRYLLNLLTLCWHFSKKPFPLFLEETGYSEEDVILQEPKAGVNFFFCNMLLVLLGCQSSFLGWRRIFQHPLLLLMKDI